MTSQNKMIQAIYFAADCHKTQKRKDEIGTPYINHPLEVMAILSECGVDDHEILSGAVLHDVVEDCGVSIEQIESLFGPNVSKYVADATDDKSLSKLEIKKAQLEKAKTISRGGKFIKCADKLSNCKGLPESAPKSWGNEYAQGYRVWCYHVCENLNVDNKMLQQKVKEMFKDLVSLPREELNEKLQKYYALC